MKQCSFIFINSTFYFLSLSSCKAGKILFAKYNYMIILRLSRNEIIIFVYIRCVRYFVQYTYVGFINIELCKLKLGDR